MMSDLLMRHEFSEIREVSLDALTSGQTSSVEGDSFSSSSSDSNNKLYSTEPSREESIWGWYDEDEDSLKSSNVKLRDAWFQATKLSKEQKDRELISKRYDNPSSALLNRLTELLDFQQISKNLKFDFSSPNEHDDECLQNDSYDSYSYQDNNQSAQLEEFNESPATGEVNVLTTWINPSPEVSLKLAGSSTGVQHLSMSMSCCVSGFRIVQLPDGDCCAQYCVVYCYGSVTHSCWKTFQEFNELAKVVDYIHRLSAERRRLYLQQQQMLLETSSVDATIPRSQYDLSNNYQGSLAKNSKRKANYVDRAVQDLSRSSSIDILFEKTIELWQHLRSHTKQTRCLRASYLIEKSIALGSFLQSLFSESPTPGLLLCFIQTKNFSAD